MGMVAASQLRLAMTGSCIAGFGVLAVLLLTARPDTAGTAQAPAAPAELRR